MLESILPTMFSALNKALKCWKCPDFQAAGHMICVEICRCAPNLLETKINDAFITSHFRKCNHDVREQRLFQVNHFFFAF